MTEEGFMKLFVVHNSEERFRCVFDTLVIRNKALVKHYKGGLHGFIENYGALCNNHITVWCDMGGDLNKAINDLVESGLTRNDDFLYIDAGSYAMVQSAFDKVERRNHLDVGVSWLNARYVNGGIYVWYAENSRD
jgi:hypothetical protein